MTHNLIKQLEETLGDLENFSPDKLQGLIQDTLKTFQELQEKLNSPDPRHREQAMDTALALKAALEEQTAALCHSIGMHPTELARFVENPANFSKEEWEALGAAKADLETFKHTLNPEKSSPHAPSKKKVKVHAKNWITG